MKILKYEETESKDVKLWFSETDYIQVEDVRGNLLEVLEEQKVPKIEKIKCQYCKKSSNFLIEELKEKEVAVYVCGHCGECMNGFD